MQEKKEQFPFREFAGSFNWQTSDAAEQVSSKTADVKNCISHNFCLVCLHSGELEEYIYDFFLKIH